MGDNVFPHIIERTTSSDPLATPKKFQDPGISLVDYYAASALTALSGNYLDPKMVAKYVYDIAEAMIEERKKRG